MGVGVWSVRSQKVSENLRERQVINGIEKKRKKCVRERERRERGEEREREREKHERQRDRKRERINKSSREVRRDERIIFFLFL